MAEPSALLDVIGTSTADYIQKSAEAEKTIVQNAQAAQAASAAVQGILEQVAQDQSTVAQQQGLAQLQVQKAAQNALVAAGQDPTTGQGRMIELISAINKQGQKVQNLLEKRHEERKNSSMFNPLDWIKLATDWSGVERDLSAEAQKLEVADKTLGALNTAIQQTVKSSEAAKESVTMATIEATSRMVGADALIRAQMAAVEGKKHNNEEVIAAKNGSAERLGAMYNFLNATRQEDQEKRLRDQFSWQKEKFDWEKEQRKLDQEAKALGKQADQLTLDYINHSLQGMGMASITPIEFETQKKLGLSKELQYHLQNGRRAMATGRTTLGSSPAESIEVLKMIPSNLPEARAQVAGILLEVEKELGTSTRPELQDTKGNEGARDRFRNQRTKDLITQQFNNVVSGGNNLFDVGDIGSYIGNSTGLGIGSLTALPISQKLLSPAIQAGTKLDDPRQVLGLGMEGVRKGIITSSELATGLSEIYRRANEITQATRGFKGFGIDLPDNGKHYYIKIGRMGGTTVDMTDPTSIGRYFSQQAGAQAYRDLTEKRKSIKGVSPSYGPGTFGQ